eukprot:Skav203873  [mRNA]  locus=scaffold1031:168695:179258:- [translate_table: standard]
MGFGSLLLKTLIAEAKRLPEIQCIGLSSLPGSIKFYKRRTGKSNAGYVNRIAWFYGTKGPSICIDTEESSSAAAMDTALNYGREDIAFLQALSTVGYQCARADSAPGDVICTDAGMDLM